MSDLENFRAEARAWLAANCPPDMRGPIERDEDRCWGGRNWVFKSEGQRLWLQRMAARGWTAPEWPKAYGGGGLTREEHKILRQEMNAIGARLPLSSFGIWMLGPALLKYGTPEQKATSAPHRARRNPLVPGLFRAGRRFRPRLAAHQGRGQGRPFPRQRPEDLDLLRRQGRLDLLPGAHRPRRRSSRRAFRSC